MMQSKLTTYAKKNNVKWILKRIGVNWQLYALVSIPLVYIIIFKYGPMYGAQIAFRNYSPIIGFKESPWVGFSNFIRFLNSPIFGKLMLNTLSLSLYSMVAGFPIPIFLAIALNYTRNKIFKKTVQMATYIPHFISVVVMVGIMMQMLEPRIGFVNNLIAAVGGERINFFGKPGYFRHLYVWSGIWQNAGWSSIIYLSALASIDPEQHESAIVDGASKIRRIIHIDIPGIMPTAITLLILSFGNFIHIGFEKVFLMQNPLNTSTSEVIDTYVFKMGIGSEAPNYSYSSAIGLFQSVIGFILIIVVNRISKKVSETSLW